MSFAPLSSTERDAIFLRALSITPMITPTAWSIIPALPPVQHPVLVHARVLPRIGFGLSARLDSLESDTISYADLAQLFITHAHTRSKPFDNLGELVKELSILAIQRLQCDEIDLMVESCKSIIRFPCSGVSVNISCSSTQTSNNKDEENANKNSRYPPGELIVIKNQSLKYEIRDLRLRALIGVLDFERKEKQEIIINLLCWTPQETWNFDFGFIIETVVKIVEGSSFFTVEALVGTIAENLLDLKLKTEEKLGEDEEEEKEKEESVTGTEREQDAKKQMVMEKIKVRVEKPGAIILAQGSGVEVTRSRSGD